MKNLLRLVTLVALTTLVNITTFAADVTDVNTIAELKGKAAGTYKFYFGDNMMIYGVYYDEYAGASLYLWDGEQGVRLTSMYEGAMKEIVDANPVGKAITGTVIALWNPSSNDGATLLVNTHNDPRCTFNGALGEDLELEPREITAAEAEKVANQPGYALDFAYVKMHGYVLYADWAKYMYDDNNDRLLLKNTCKIIPPIDFDMINDNKKGTFQGALMVEHITDKTGTYVNLALGVMTEDWFSEDAEQSGDELILDANGSFDTNEAYAQVTAIVKNLPFKADIPATIHLPFPMTAEQIVSNFGENTKLYYMDKNAGEHMATADHAVFDLRGYDYTENPTEAGTVYVVIPTKDADELRFEGVTTIQYQQEGYHSYMDWGTFEKVSIRGAFSKKTLDPTKHLLYNENGGLVVATEGTEAKAFTGYFEVPANAINNTEVRLSATQQGTACDNPFVTTFDSENILPKEAGIYYYKVVPTAAGIVTALSENKNLQDGDIQVFKSCEDVEPINYCENAFAARFEVNPENSASYIMVVNKAQATEADEKFTLTYSEYQPGDRFDLPKPIEGMGGSMTSMEFNGDFYYLYTIDADSPQFVYINANNRATNPKTHFLIYSAEDPSKVLARSNDIFQIADFEAEAGEKFVIQLHNEESKAFNFSIGYEPIGYGQTMLYAIPMQLGENLLAVKEYKQYYHFTTTNQSVLSVDIPGQVQVDFIDVDGYAIAQKVEGTVYSTAMALDKDTKCYIRFDKVKEPVNFIFSDGSETAIEQTHDELPVFVQNGQIIVNTEAYTTIFEITGTKVAESHSKTAITLPSGIYIVSVNGKAYKLTVH